MNLKKRLMRLIASLPFKIPIKYRVSYELVWVQSFEDPTQMGETRRDTATNERQILIKLGLSATETVSTLVHELFHVFNFEYKLGLTETQVIGLEKAVFTFLKINKLF